MKTNDSLILLLVVFVAVFAANFATYRISEMDRAREEWKHLQSQPAPPTV